MRKYLVSLWGSRGLAYQVTRELKSNPLAAIIYMLGLLVPSIVHSDLVPQDVLEAIFVLDGITLLIFPILTLAVSLRLWTRSVVVHGFMKRFATVFFYIVLAGFIIVGPMLAISTMIFGSMSVDSMNVLADIFVHSSGPVSILFGSLVAAYVTCLLVQIPLSESVALRIPLRIFVATFIIMAGINAFEFIAGLVLYSVDVPILTLLNIVTSAALSTFVLIAALTAFSRHFLKMKVSEVDGA